jgi:flagellar hook-basal body complex protein FliE
MANSIQQSSLPVQKTQVPKPGTSRSAAKQISDSFQKMFDEVNQDQVIAEKKVADMMTRKNKDISGTILAMEKADVSLRMLMAVRNKIVSAYQEVMRMQV